MRIIRGTFTLLSAGLLALVACRSESSSARGPETEPPNENPHATDNALGWVATCQFRYRAAHAAYAPHSECEHAVNDPSVHVRVEWATADGWGARAWKAGVRGDCVYVGGWATEAQYLYTSDEHHGAIVGGSSCDGGTSAAPRSWPEYVQASFESRLQAQWRQIKLYRARHAAFPPADSVRMYSDSLRHFRFLWVGAAGYAAEATTPAVPGVSCVVWDGALGGHAPPRTQEHRSAPAGVVVCDDFTLARHGRP